MNRVCPVCEADLLEVEPSALVPYSEKQRPENRAESDGPGPVGGLWFDSPECRDEYKEEHDDEN